MTLRTKIFGLFAIAILFSMVREWSAPEACPFPAGSQFIARK
jgi:hypothetical protein